MQYIVYCAKSYENFARANIYSLSAWQTSLPISERQMRTHATYVAEFDERTGQPTTEKRKSTTFGGASI